MDHTCVYDKTLTAKSTHVLGEVEPPSLTECTTWWCCRKACFGIFRWIYSAENKTLSNTMSTIIRSNDQALSPPEVLLSGLTDGTGPTPPTSKSVVAAPPKVAVNVSVSASITQQQKSVQTENKNPAKKVTLRLTKIGDRIRKLFSFGGGGYTTSQAKPANNRSGKTISGLCSGASESQDTEQDAFGILHGGNYGHSSATTEGRVVNGVVKPGKGKGGNSKQRKGLQPPTPAQVGRNPNRSTRHTRSRPVDSRHPGHKPQSTKPPAETDSAAIKRNLAKIRKNHAEKMLEETKDDGEADSSDLSVDKARSIPELNVVEGIVSSLPSSGPTASEAKPQNSTNSAACKHSKNSSGSKEEPHKRGKKLGDDRGGPVASFGEESPEAKARREALEALANRDKTFQLAVKMSLSDVPYRNRVFEPKSGLRGIAAALQRGQTVETFSSGLCGIESVVLAVARDGKQTEVFTYCLALTAHWSDDEWQSIMVGNSVVVPKFNDRAADLFGSSQDLGAYAGRKGFNLAIFEMSEDGPVLVWKSEFSKDASWIGLEYIRPRPGVTAHYKLVDSMAAAKKERDCLLRPGSVHVSLGFRRRDLGVNHQDEQLLEMLKSSVPRKRESWFRCLGCDLWDYIWGRQARGVLTLVTVTERSNSIHAGLQPNVELDHALAPTSTFVCEMKWQPRWSLQAEKYVVAVSAHTANSFANSVVGAEALCVANNLGLGSYKASMGTVNGAAGAASLTRAAHVATPESVAMMNAHIPALFACFKNRGCDLSSVLADDIGTYRVELRNGAIRAGRLASRAGEEFQSAICYTAPVEEFYAKEGAMKINQERQALANHLRSIGVPDGDPDMPNSFRAAKPQKRGDSTPGPPPKVDVKTEVPIARAPWGVGQTDAGPIGIGLFPTPCGATLAQAAAGRSMVTPVVDEDETEQFLRFAADFLETVLGNFELKEALTGQVEQEDSFEAYRAGYADKVSAGTLAAHKILWDSYHDGTISRGDRRKFLRKTYFVKTEHNAKQGRGRPRMIAQMSLFEKISAYQIVGLYKIYNETVGRSYQVKGVSREEFAELVSAATSRRFTITDYSSYETSLSARLRAASEVVLAEGLCEAAGFTRTRGALASIMGPKSLLHSSFVQFLLGSRCSGNFETSTGNGLINHLLICYCWSLHQIKNPELKDEKVPFHLCEGDDGVVSDDFMDPDVLLRLGFKYSTEVSGVNPGEADFLSVGYIDGQSYPDVFKTCNKLLWAVGCPEMRNSRHQFLTRAKAYSCWLSHGDHPIIGALVVKIGELTSRASSFKGSEKFLNRWGGETNAIADYPTKSSPTDARRSIVHHGVAGFPPIPVAIQKQCEAYIALGDWSFFTFLTDQPSARELINSNYLIGGPLGGMGRLATPAPTGEYLEFLKLMRLAGLETEASTVYPLCRPWQDSSPCQGFPA